MYGLPKKNTKKQTKKNCVRWPKSVFFFKNFAFTFTSSSKQAWVCGWFVNVGRFVSPREYMCFIHKATTTLLPSNFTRKTTILSTYNSNRIKLMSDAFIFAANIHAQLIHTHELFFLFLLLYFEFTFSFLSFVFRFLSAIMPI